MYLKDKLDYDAGCHSNFLAAQRSAYTRDDSISRGVEKNNKSQPEASSECTARHRQPHWKMALTHPNRWINSQFALNSSRNRSIAKSRVPSIIKLDVISSLELSALSIAAIKSLQESKDTHPLALLLCPSLPGVLHTALARRNIQETSLVMSILSSFTSFLDVEQVSCIHAVDYCRALEPFAIDWPYPDPLNKFYQRTILNFLERLILLDPHWKSTSEFKTLLLALLEHTKDSPPCFNLLVLGRMYPSDLSCFDIKAIVRLGLYKCLLQGIYERLDELMVSERARLDNALYLLESLLRHSSHVAKHMIDTGLIAVLDNIFASECLFRESFYPACRLVRLICQADPSYRDVICVQVPLITTVHEFMAFHWDATKELISLLGEIDGQTAVDEESDGFKRCADQLLKSFFQQILTSKWPTMAIHVIAALCSSEWVHPSIMRLCKTEPVVLAAASKIFDSEHAIQRKGLIIFAPLIPRAPRTKIEFRQSISSEATLVEGVPTSSGSSSRTTLDVVVEIVERLEEFERVQLKDATS
jgi:hypothetical protein